MDFTYAPGLITYVKDDLVLAKIEFPANSDGTVWDITHTFVDESLRGQGVAGKLLAEVVRLAKESDVKLKPTCPYAIAAFERKPEYQVLEYQD